VSLAVPLALAPELDVTVRAAEPVITESEQTARMVDVQDVQADASSVNGTLVNRTANAVRSVRLAVTDNFLFTDVQHAEADDPSRAMQFMVAGPIPPRGSVPFRYERPSSLPDRGDGEFRTDVTVRSVTLQLVTAPQ